MASGRGSVRGRIRGHNVASRRATVMRSQPVYEILDPVETEFEDYLPVTAPVRRLGPPVRYRRPIEERITLPPAPQVVYVPIPVSRNQRRARGPRSNSGRGVQQNQGQRNNVRGVVNHPYFKNRPAGIASRGGRGGQVRGRAAPRKNRFAPPPKKSLSQLDRELEDYMRKSKHPKIVI
ncbi:hypothetical protein COOONC_10789 [Cooperia oncophora]